LKFAPMAIPAMALLQQHDARLGILTDQRHGSVQRSKLRGIRNWGCNRAIQTNRLVCLSVSLVYCGQTVGWIKTPLGMEVGLWPRRHCVKWGPSSPQKGDVPLFGGAGSPSNNVAWAEAYLHTKWDLDPSSRLPTTH